jgi:hypothetical protein
MLVLIKNFRVSAALPERQCSGSIDRERAYVLDLVWRKDVAVVVIAILEGVVQDARVMSWRDIGRFGL